MSISREIPEPDQYRFVLRRYDRIPTLELKVHGYDEVAKSRAVSMRGVLAQTLFIRKKETKDRATKLGWLDETAAWQTEQAEKSKVLSPMEERILEIVGNSSRPLSRGDIAERMKVQPYDLKDSLARLRKIGVLHMEGTAVNARYLPAV